MVFFDIASIYNIAALVDKLILFLINAVGIELVLWAYVANRYTRPSRSLLFWVVAVLLWVDLDAASALAPTYLVQANSFAIALWAQRALMAMLAVFFAGFYIFCLHFPAKNYFDKTRRGKENLQIAAWTFFFLLSFTPLVVKDVAVNGALPMALWFMPGPMFWVYAIFAFLTLVFSFADLSKNLRFADAGKRDVARFWALSAGLFGITNLLFNIVGAVFGGILGYIGFFSLFADYAVIALLGYLAYQAAHEKLFGIKVILVEIFVGLMGAILAVLPFFIEVIWQQALLFILFALFCGFGYLLIKSTINEYREKEQLELRVADRTKELQSAKLNLEEANSVLEIRVKARTRELEKLNRTLEEKIAGRTNDLEAKIRDLEKFQRITVGRELKMIELKKEIEFLRASINKAEDAPSGMAQNQ
ncbi:MAG: hypothetical protein MUD10_01220 [Candidatus Pacebacteria bacterium]|jgi:MFS family permease|nr:hypothetical protein [Candidatus Paceibacterota bacterium]